MPDSTWLPWILLPGVGALIGYATNWLAIKMLFHPRKKRWGLQGLLPRRQADLAESVGRIVADDLLNADTLLSQFDHIDLAPAFSRLVDRAIERKSEELRSIPLIGAFITPERLRSLRNALLDEVLQSRSQIINELKSVARQHLDIAALVQSRLLAFDLRELEELIHRVASREFRSIEIWGALLGTLIGLAQAGILALVAA